MPSRKLIDRKGRLLEIAAHEFIRTFMSTCVDFGRGCVDQWAIDVKDPQGTILIEGHAGLNSSQRIFGHEKRSFHRVIISQNRTARRVAS